MKLTGEYRTAQAFEGDLKLSLRGLPAGARIQRASVKLAPGSGANEQLISFPGNAFGTQLIGTQEVDFHARRTLARIAGTPAPGGGLLVDIGAGLYQEVAGNGALKLSTSDTTSWAFTGGALPGLTVNKLKIISGSIASVTIRAVPTNVSIKLGSIPPFWTLVGELSAEQTSPDFADVLNAFLTTAVPVDGFITLPFIVHIDGLGILKTTIEIDYFIEQAVLPPHLPEVNILYNYSAQPGVDLSMTTARLPRKAKPLGASAQVQGEFAASRIAVGPIGVDEEGTGLQSYEVAPNRTAAQSFTFDDEYSATGIDLPLGKTAPGLTGIHVSIRADFDGKPSGDVLATAEVVAEKPLPNQSTWGTATLPAPFRVLKDVRYWLVLQSQDGKAEWLVRANRTTEIALQGSDNGGLSWRQAIHKEVPSTKEGLAALFRLRNTPDRFSVPIILQVGSGENAVRRYLHEYNSLGRIDFNFPFEETLKEHLDQPGARASDCGPSEMIENGLFEVPLLDSAALKVLGRDFQSGVKITGSVPVEIEGQPNKLNLNVTRFLYLAIANQFMPRINIAGSNPAETTFAEIIQAINRSLGRQGFRRVASRQTRLVLRLLPISVEEPELSPPIPIINLLRAQAVLQFTINVRPNPPAESGCPAGKNAASELFGFAERSGLANQPITGEADLFFGVELDDNTHLYLNIRCEGTTTNFTVSGSANYCVDCTAATFAVDVAAAINAEVARKPIRLTWAPRVPIPFAGELETDVPLPLIAAVLVDNNLMLTGPILSNEAQAPITVFIDGPDVPGEVWQRRGLAVRVQRPSGGYSLMLNADGDDEANEANEANEADEAAVSQVVRITGGCAYNLRFKFQRAYLNSSGLSGISAPLPTTGEPYPQGTTVSPVPLKWQIDWLDEQAELVQTDQHVLNGQYFALDRELFVVGYQVKAPQSAHFADVQFIQEAGGLSYLDDVEFSPLIVLSDNSQFTEWTTDNVPKGWSLERGLVGRAFRENNFAGVQLVGNSERDSVLMQSIPVEAGIIYILRLRAVVTPLPESSSSNPNARSRAELRWVGTNEVVRIFLDEPGFPSFAWRGAAPTGATAVQIHLIQPRQTGADAASLSVEWITLEREDLVEVPLTILSEAPGQLTLRDLRIAYDVDEFIIESPRRSEVVVDDDGGGDGEGDDGEDGDDTGDGDDGEEGDKDDKDKDEEKPKPRTKPTDPPKPPTTDEDSEDESKPEFVPSELPVMETLEALTVQVVAPAAVRRMAAPISIAPQKLSARASAIAAWPVEMISGVGKQVVEILHELPRAVKNIRQLAAIEPTVEIGIPPQRLIDITARARQLLELNVLARDFAALNEMELDAVLALRPAELAERSGQSPERVKQFKADLRKIRQLLKASVFRKLTIADLS